MPVAVEDILKDYVYSPENVERVNFTGRKEKIAIEEPNPEWTQRFLEVKERIEKALGSFVVSVAHAGSTSIPGLPAKDVIDIDCTVKDSNDEAAYVDKLTNAGFILLFREHAWHEHRFFHENWPNAFRVNLHVWSPDSPEVERHRILKEWLLKSPEDLQLYAKVKREAAQASTTAGEGVMAYNMRKEDTIREILRRAFRDQGYIQ